MTIFGRAALALLAFPLVVLSHAACSRENPTPAAGTPAAAPVPAPATAPPAGTRLYVSDETGGAIVIVDPVAGTVIERIAVGKRPRGLKVSRDGSTLYVALSGSPIAGPGVDESKLPPADRAADGIGVVDLKARKLVKVLPSGQDPEAFDLSPDEKTLYVSNEETAEMSVLDIASATVRARVKVGDEPEGVTVRPDGKEVWVTCEDENEVVAVDTATLKIAGRVETGARPRAIAFTKDGALAFVTNENSGTVAIVDTATYKLVTVPGPSFPKVKELPAPPRPMGIVLTPDAGRVVVSLGRSTQIGVIDVATRAIVEMIGDVGARPWGIDVSADGTKAYTANGPSGDVSVVDLVARKVERKISTGGSPWGLVRR